MHSVEKREILSLSQKKKFRQIHSLVTYLVKPLLSRNFCQKCVREISRNFHTVTGCLENTNPGCLFSVKSLFGSSKHYTIQFDEKTMISRKNTISKRFDGKSRQPGKVSKYYPG